MKVEVLGPGCARCGELHERAKEAISLSQVAAELRKVEALDEIAAHGVLFPPALVIDGDVKCSGKVPTVEQIIGWLES